MCWIPGLMLAYLVQEAASQKEKNLYAKKKASAFDVSNCGGGKKLERNLKNNL